MMRWQQERGNLVGFQRFNSELYIQQFDISAAQDMPGGLVESWWNQGC